MNAPTPQLAQDERQPVALARLKKRADFLTAREGRKWITPHFILQQAPNREDSARVGFTTTKKLGSAVVRNRIRRRLRAAAAEVLPDFATSGQDYVLIARDSALTCPYAELTGKLRWSLTRIGGAK